MHRVLAARQSFKPDSYRMLSSEISWACMHACACAGICLLLLPHLASCQTMKSPSTAPGLAALNALISEERTSAWARRYAASSCPSSRLWRPLASGASGPEEEGEGARGEVSSLLTRALWPSCTFEASGGSEEATRPRRVACLSTRRSSICIGGRG